MASKKAAKEKSAKKSATRDPISFKVSGPYPLKIVKRKFGRCIDDDVFKHFWSVHSGLAKQKGCYIFAMSKRPFYVGKASKSFKQEVFNPKNMNTYQQVVGNVQGKASLYLVSLASHKGKPPYSVIGKVEKLLIGLAHDANPDLKNVHHRNKAPRFLIGGIYNSGKGQRSMAAKALRSVLSLTK